MGVYINYSMLLFMFKFLSISAATATTQPTGAATAQHNPGHADNGGEDVAMVQVRFFIVRSLMIVSRTTVV